MFPLGSKVKKVSSIGLPTYQKHYASYLLMLIYKVFLKTFIVCVRKSLGKHMMENFAIQFWLPIEQQKNLDSI